MFFYISTRHDRFVNKVYVECRILSSKSYGGNVVDVSLRSSRIDGDMVDDPVPATGDIVQGYVIQTTNKGCFLRFSRCVEGRSTLKELCDSYVANPSASFPMGRLIVGKVKEIRSTNKKGRKCIQADVDMRESTMVDAEENLRSFDDIASGQRYKGIVQTITDYGVFVRIENSNIDGLVHLSECSDKFVKNLGTFYSPGDLVKVIVVKKDNDKKRVGLSMKASYFVDSSDTEVEEPSIDSDEMEVKGSDDDDESVDNGAFRELRSSDDSDDVRHADRKSVV